MNGLFFETFFCSPAFANLVNSAANDSENDRKLALLDYAKKARNDFIRLLVLVQWSKKPSVSRCWEILSFLQRQDSCFRDAADELYAVSTRQLFARAPVYDVTTAVDVLTLGTYKRLPKSICTHLTSFGSKGAAVIDKSEAVAYVNDVIHYRLFNTPIPKEFSSITTGNGRVYIRVDGEFEVSMTVAGPTLTSPWIVLSLTVLVADTQGDQFGFNPQQYEWVREVARTKMLESDNPLNQLYFFLHKLCIRIALQELERQAGILYRSKLIPHLKVATKPTLNIRYWSVSNIGQISTATAPPSLSFHLKNNSLIVEHEPVLYHPISGDAVKFQVRTSCVSLEATLNEAMSANSNFRLFTLFSHLKGQMGKSGLNSDRLSLSLDKIRSFLRIQLFDSIDIAAYVNVNDGRILFEAPMSLGKISQHSVAKLQKLIDTTYEADITEVLRQLRREAILTYLSHCGSAYNLVPFFELPDSESKIETTNEDLKKPPINGSFDRVFFRLVDNTHYYLLLDIKHNEVSTSLVIQQRKNGKFEVDLTLALVPPMAFPPLFDVEADTSSNDQSGPIPKKLKKDMKDENDLWSVCLLETLQLAQSKINFVALKAQFLTKNISVQDNGQMLVFRLPSPPLNVSKMQLSFVGVTHWRVDVYESVPVYTLSSISSVENKISYSAKDRCWSFCYSNAETLQLFVRDLRVLGRIMELARQYQEVVKNHPDMEHVNLLQLCPTLITFCYCSNCFVAITWRFETKGYSVSYSMDPPPYSHYLQAKLNNKPDLLEFLKSLVYGSTCLRVLRRFSNVNSKVLPLDFTLVSHSIYHTRWIYRNRYAIDFRFVNPSHVIMEDGSVKLFSSATSVLPANLSRLHPIPNFHQFCIKHLLPFCAQPGSQNSSSSKLSDIRIKVSAIQLALETLHAYLGSIILHAQTAALLKQEIGDKVTVDINHETGAISAKINNFEYLFGLEDFFYFTLSIRPHQSQLRASTDTYLLSASAVIRQQGAQTVSSPILSCLTDVFNKEISIAPYDTNRLRSFLRLLTFPIPILEGLFAALSDDSQLGGNTNQMKLCFCFPKEFSCAGKPCIAHRSTQHTVNLLLKVYHQKLFVYAPLSYRYTPMREKLLFWEVNRTSFNQHQPALNPLNGLQGALLNNELHQLATTPLEKLRERFEQSSRIASGNN